MAKGWLRMEFEIWPEASRMAAMASMSLALARPLEMIC
jgi:hypothetical protein